MQIRLSDEGKELLEKVDTSRMGWLYDHALDGVPEFEKLREYESRKEWKAK